MASTMEFCNYNKKLGRVLDNLKNQENDILWFKLREAVQYMQLFLYVYKCSWYGSYVYNMTFKN